MAFEGPPAPYTTDEAIRLLQNEIPIFASLSKAERDEIRNKHPEYQNIKSLWKEATDCDLAETWRVDHILPVGTKKSLPKLTDTLVRRSFLRLVSPANIILTPLQLCGIGDFDIYLKIYEEHRTNYMKDLA